MNLRGFLLFLACFAWACGSKQEGPLDAAAPQETRIAKKVQGHTVVDMLDERATCEFGHRGVLLDLGSPQRRRVRVRATKEATSRTQNVEHEGATWIRVTGRELSVTFLPPADLGPVDGTTVIELKARRGAAKTVSVSLNGRTVGAHRFKQDSAENIRLKTATPIWTNGENELVLRFSGAKSSDVAADIDWVRVGPFDSDEPFAAPTREGVLSTISAKGVARRSASLRGQSYLRCIEYIPSGASVQASLSLVGEGEAVVEARALKDREAPRTLGQRTLHSGDSWQDVSFDLNGVDGLAQISFVVVSASKGARVAIGEPKVVSASTMPKSDVMPRARGVILIVQSSVSARAMSVYGGPNEMPELGALASAGIVFESHRATTSLASGSFASLLTGLEPQEHAVTDPFSKLPENLATIAQTAKQAGIRTALFTANPTTSAAFGFSRDWSTYSSIAASDTVTATKIFDDAAAWLRSNKDDRFLLVLHTRAGHPPWDATREQLKEMPPASYSGPIEARHAAETLLRIRQSRAARFNDSDRTRLWALHRLALAEHDAALGRLLQILRAIERDEDTTILVTSDIGLDTLANVPFAEGESLDETSLDTAMILRPPTRVVTPASRVKSPTSGVDVAKTVLATLGLAAPAQFGGHDLWAIAGGAEEPTGRVRTAWLGNRFSMMWGSFVLSGVGSEPIRFCDRLLEPSCATDVRGTYPLAFHRFLSLAEDRQRQVHAAPRVPVEVDLALANELRVWGRMAP